MKSADDSRRTYVRIFIKDSFNNGMPDQRSYILLARGRFLELVVMNILPVRDFLRICTRTVMPSCDGVRVALVQTIIDQNVNCFIVYIGSDRKTASIDTNKTMRKVRRRTLIDMSTHMRSRSLRGEWLSLSKELRVSVDDLYDVVTNA